MRKLNRNQVIILLSLCLILCSVCATYFAILPTIDYSKFPTSVPQTATIPLPPTPLKQRTITAEVMCKQFVRDRLKAPSSARFSNEDVYGIEGKPANYHTVTGTVEAQNVWGVMIRNQFRCDLHYIPEDRDRWILDNLVIE